jgi:hypothetical protein
VFLQGPGVLAWRGLFLELVHIRKGYLVFLHIFWPEPEEASYLQKLDHDTIVDKLLADELYGALNRAP